MLRKDFGPFHFPGVLMGFHRPSRSRAIRILPEAPRCFDSQEQWKLYQAAARACAKNDLSSYIFCSDCKPAYKKLMMLENRCEHPETQFRLDNDGFTGYWPKVEAA